MAIQPWVSQHIYHLGYMQSANNAVCKHAGMSHGVIAQQHQSSAQRLYAMQSCNMAGG